MRLLASAFVSVALLAELLFAQTPPTQRPQFELVQPDLFAAPGGQPNAWADFDGDGDLDLFVGFGQGKPNRLYRNDHGVFSEIAQEAGVADLTDTRAAAWGDFDGDGHIDLYVGFTRRSETRNKLYRNDGHGRFTDVAAQMGVAGGDKATPSRWGDYDNDGRPDLYVSSYIDQPLKEHDFLYHNEGGRFCRRAVRARPHARRDARRPMGGFRRRWRSRSRAHQQQPTGAHPLYRNNLPRDRARQSVQVMVADDRGRATRAGSEVRAYVAGRRTLLGTGLVDTGSGYSSQNVMPVHIGLGSTGRIDVEVTTMGKTGRSVTRVAGVTPGSIRGGVLVVKMPTR